MAKFHHKILEERSLCGKYKVIPEEPLQIELLFENIRASEQSNEEIINEYFRPIFFCYRNASSSDLFCMDIMIDAIKRDILKYEIEFVSSSPDINEILESDRRGGGRVYESGEHKGMKKWIEKYLAEKGVKVARGEVSKLGYEVDVGSISENIYVECGDTEPRKIFEFLRNGLNIGILQYNAEHIIWFVSSEEFQRYAKEKAYGYL